MKKSGKIPGYGIITAMLTPLHPDETVDIPAVRRLIERMSEAGIHGIFTMATSGECARLAPEQQDLLIQTAAEADRRESLLYIGVSACGTAQAIRNIRRAEQAGADVLVSTLPYYYHALTVEEQISYYQALADSTELPILMYNIPGNVGCRIELETVQFLRKVDNIVGIKDSSGDMVYFDQLMSLQSVDYRVLSGVEFHVARALRAGASGVVPSLSNIYPYTYMELWKAAQQGDFDRVDQIQQKLDRINSIHKRHQGRLSVMACRKILLAYEGLGEDCMTHPHAPGPAALKEELIAAAAQLKLR